MSLTNPDTSSVDDINKAIIETLRETLQKTAEVNKRGSKPPTSPDVTKIAKDIRNLEQKVYDLTNSVQTISKNNKKNRANAK